MMPSNLPGDPTPEESMSAKVAAMKGAIAEDARKIDGGGSDHSWALPFIACVAAAVIEQSALRLLGYRVWHPFELLPREVIVEHATVLLLSSPYVWPVLAGLVSGFFIFLLSPGNAGDVSCVIAGFRWDRNSFCRGWLCTGATGSGKTVAAVNPVMHQVFMREAGREKASWAGSPLERKAAQLIAEALKSSAPIVARRKELESELSRREHEREELFQMAVIEDLDDNQSAGKEMSLQHLDSELATAKAEQVGRQAERSVCDDPERQKFLENEVERLDQVIRGLEVDRAAVSSEDKPGPLGPRQQVLRQLDLEIMQKREAMDRIETDELQPLRDTLQRQMRAIEEARYTSYPWGGLCVDEKGLYWQTLQGMARHYNREHHLMLLQTRPDWAPQAWKPPARFNLLSDDQIPANTYAKAIVDTATQVAGGEGDKGFFKTQAESNIGWVITLQREVKRGLVAQGHDAKSIAMPSMKLCLELLSDKQTFTRWTQEHGLVAISQKDATNKVTRIPPRIQSPKLTEALGHFETRYWSQPADQLGGVTGTIYNYLTYFTNDDVAAVFCSDNTFDFRDIDRGMILCVSMPQKLQTERRYVCTLLKLLFYQHVLRRFDLGDFNPKWRNRNLLICWQDEAQRFVTSDDGNVDVIREASATTFMACQAKPSLYAPLGGKEKASVTILNLRNRVIFQAADDECATGSADFLGKAEKTKTSRTTSSSGSSISYSKEDVHRIKPHEFRALPKFEAVVCHADGKYRRSILCPVTVDGRLRTEWLNFGQKLAYWWQSLMGEGWKPKQRAAPPRVDD